MPGLQMTRYLNSAPWPLENSWVLQEGPLASQARSYLGLLSLKSGIALLVGGLRNNPRYSLLPRLIAPIAVDHTPAFPKG